MASKRKRFSQRIEAATRDRSTDAPAPLRPPEPEDPPIELAAFVGLTLIGLLVIIGLAVVFGIRSVESTIERQALGTLRANGIRNVEVDADGLDLTLVGTVSIENQVELARRIGESIEGVRTVTADNVVFVPPEEVVEIDLVVEPLAFSWVGSSVTVSGTVSDEATRDVILVDLEGHWDEVVSDALVVREGIPSERDWLPRVLQVVETSGDALMEGTVVANADLSFVLVAGDVETRRDQFLLTTEIEEILSAVTFDFTSGLTIEEEEPPPTSSTVVAGGTSTTAATTTTSTTLPPVVVELQVTLDELIEGKVVEFEFGSSVITAEGKALLDEVLDALRRFPDVRVEIGGHTDDIGSEQSNLILSRLRANAVLTYLVDRGESPVRFQIVGYGESRPVADNSTEEGRARNRRIEFTALAE